MLIPTITDSQHGPGLFVVTQPQINQILKADSETTFGKKLSIFSGYLQVHERAQITALPSELLVTLTAAVPVLMHTIPGLNLNLPAARSRCILEISNVTPGEHLLLYSSEQKQQIPPAMQCQGWPSCPQLNYTRDFCKTGKGFPKLGKITTKCGTTQLL